MMRAPSRDAGAVPAWLPWSLVALLVLAALALYAARDTLVARLGPPADVPAPTDEPAPPGGTADDAARAGAARDTFAAVLGRDPAWPDDAGAEDVPCDEIAADLARATAALAERAGTDAESVRGRLDDAIRRLARARPSPSGESGAPERVYANVVHLGRVLGAERAADLARLAAFAEPIAEPLALAVVRHARSRPACDPAHPLATPGVAYDYGVFLLGTVGGQGYLGRRMPTTATLARFWALVAVGDAIAAGENVHGFDPQGAIAVTRAAAERAPLALKGRYLAELDRLAVLDPGGPRPAR